MNLAGSFDEILQMGAGQEVAEIDEFTVILVFNVDDTPTVLSTANLLAVDDNRLFAANNGEGNYAL